MKPKKERAANVRKPLQNRDVLNSQVRNGYAGYGCGFKPVLNLGWCSENFALWLETGLAVCGTTNPRPASLGTIGRSFFRRVVL